MNSPPWYKSAFSADYLERYSHRDEGEAERAADLFVERTGLPRGAAVMDLCCGGGRHVAAFCRRGFAVYGLDLSGELLREARGKVGECGDRPAGLVCADKRFHPFADASFDAVTHFFTAFGYFQDDAENFRVFGEVTRVLRPGGWYLFDFLNAAPVFEELAGGRVVEKEEDLHDGVTLHSARGLSADTRRVEKEMVFREHGREFRRITESVRLFRPDELREGLTRNGLAVRDVWGNYDGSPWQETDSARWIALCRKD